MPHYFKQNKVQAPQPPNTFEKAVWQYVTCPLTDPLPEPKTRIEQMAKDFVFDGKTATDIRKLTEINRCVSTCETYQRYQTDPDSFNSLPPIKINIGYGRDEGLPDSSGKQEILADPVESSAEDLAAPAISDQSANPSVSQQISPDLFLNPKSLVSAVLRYCYEVTKDESFRNIPATPQQVQALMDKLLQSDTLFKSYVGPYGNQLGKVISNLAAYRDRLEEKEMEETAKNWVDDFSASRGVEDSAANLRTEPPSAVDYMLETTPEQLWENRFDIMNRLDTEKAALLRKVYPSRTLQELEQFRREIGNFVSGWTKAYILDSLAYWISTKKAELAAAA